MRLYISFESEGEPAFFHAVLNFSAVTFVVICLAAPLIAPPTALTPFLIPEPIFLSASSGPSFNPCLF